MAQKIAFSTFKLMQKNYRMLMTFGFPTFVILVLVSSLFMVADYLLLTIIFLLFPLMMSMALIAKQLVEQPKNISLKTFYFGYINLKQMLWLMLKNVGIPLMTLIVVFLISYILLIFGFTVYLDINFPQLMSQLTSELQYEQVVSLLLQVPHSMDILISLLGMAGFISFLVALWVRIPEHYTFYLSLDLKKDIFESSTISRILLKQVMGSYYVFQLSTILPLFVVPLFVLLVVPYLGWWIPLINEQFDLFIRIFIAMMVETPLFIFYYLSNAIYYRQIKLEFIEKMKQKDGPIKYKTGDNSTPLTP